MRHLVNFKIFEENESKNYDDIISEVSDMLLDLKDELFEVTFNKFSESSAELGIKKKGGFEWKDITNVMYRINTYLSSLDEITLSYFDSKSKEVNNKLFISKREVF